MMPIMRAIELEVPVIGRSYSPAFLGWFSAIRNSFVKDYRCSSYTLGILAFYTCGTAIYATGHRNWCNEKAILMPNFSPSFCETVICLPPQGRNTCKMAGKKAC